MRLRLAAIALCLALVPAAAAAAAALPFKAKLTAATHTPKVNVKWPYSVRVTNLKGKPMRATITMQIVDPLGGVHPVQFGANTKNVTNWPFKGTFRDYVIWPPDSAVGVTLVFRTIVKTAKGKVKLTYDVSPHT